jgi:hypothetical protein
MKRPGKLFELSDTGRWIGFAVVRVCAQTAAIAGVIVCCVAAWVSRIVSVWSGYRTKGGLPLDSLR